MSASLPITRGGEWNTWWMWNPHYKDCTFFSALFPLPFLGIRWNHNGKLFPWQAVVDAGMSRVASVLAVQSSNNFSAIAQGCPDLQHMNLLQIWLASKFCNINISQHVTSAATHSCTTWISTVAPEVRWTSQKLRINFSMHKKHIGFRIDDFKLRIALCTAWEQDTCSLLPHFV